MLKKDKGAITIFVVVIIGIISILYASVYFLLGVESRIYQSLENRTRAYYVAESGMERGLALLKENVLTPFSISNPFASSYNDNHRFDVTITQIAPNIYKVSSMGIYGNTKRVVEASVLKTETDFLIQSWIEVN